MARRTKDDAMATRAAIIAAARGVFYHKGVTNTSLEEIAQAAGVTRGAIYFHFADKAELFYAMRDQVRQPIVDRTHRSLDHAQPGMSPLDRVATFLEALVDVFVGDELARCTLWIMTFRCEYVNEFSDELDNAYAMHADLKEKLVRLYRAARRDGSLRADTTPERAAIDTVAFAAGLIRLLVIDHDGALLADDARALVGDHIRAKGSAQPVRRRAGQSSRTDEKKVSAASRPRSVAKAAAGPTTTNSTRRPPRATKRASA